MATAEGSSYRETAIRAAVEAGRIIREGGPARGVERKGAGDYVTRVDRAAEEAVASLLRTETPGIPMVGEERGGEPSGRYWLVDPLDGTTNYVHAFPVVGVSVALMEEGTPVAGAVHAPFLATTWSAARGAGADRDGRPIGVSSASPEDALVGTGFPFRHKDRLKEYLRVMVAALERFEDLRRPGAVALDLAWVAEGVFDGFFELGLFSWDVAAGALLVQEAGGVVTDWTGGDGHLEGDVLAGGPAVHAALLDLTRPP